ncbi:hypothetical protein [Cyclobacterium jeungdonense]|uniref:Uncharacterized protein n=1 Tax=Cyclobacterium jeungdonense TaxID=708087 RepID=A0ABT8C7J0_9BACT|nr:hypothetical protein [Cyclobacterium jeungdonense]MDN3688763.1 hypothetical protein [Cyclobacterium jeungdonense]
MKTIPAQLPMILHYLNGESGKENVKESLEKTYEWLSYKLSRIADHEQVKKLKAKPYDPQVQEQWRQILEEAIAEEDLFYKELEVMLYEAVEFIQINDPKGYQTLLANQNSLKTETSKSEK